MIISSDVETAFEKLQHPFMMKSIQPTESRKKLPLLITGIYENAELTLYSVVED